MNNEDTSPDCNVPIGTNSVEVAAIGKQLSRPLRPHLERALESGNAQRVIDALTPKQRAFVEEFMKDLNAAQAVLRCGYQTEKNTAKIANDLLTNRGVRFAIDALKKERAKDSSVTSDYVLKEIVAIVENVKEQNPQAALRGLELLAKHLGMFIERTEISGRDGEAIKYEKVREDANDFTRAIASLAERERTRGLAAVPDKRAEG